MLTPRLRRSIGGSKLGSRAQLCPAVPVVTCACGLACYDPKVYGCKSGGLTQNPKDQEGTCAGGSGGDPLVRTPSGCQWYLKGLAGQVYNLISGADDTLNTLLVPANLTDADHKENGTFHGTLSFRHKDNVVEASVDPEGNLTVKVDGKLQPFDSRFTAGEMKGKVVRHMTYFGQYAEIITPALTYAVQAVQPMTGEAGFNRGHADVDVTLRQNVPTLHGLLGQSFQDIGGQDCAGDYQFHGEGQEADYVLPLLSSIPNSRPVSVSKVSRKLIEGEGNTLPVTVSIIS
ncbi:hypothetical protein WJX74_005062 [Apatococcus lobatus]|uniref:Uncharacterized protein n=1 Tax=Apatococcus lobatus TaxID=904363 RepID=A0AAW1SEM9_9CHLO